MSRRFFDITSALNAIVHHDDSNAFEFLFNAFYDKLMRVGLYYLGKDAVAEDAVSEVFFKLWAGRSKLSKVENLENYLFTMTKNQCLYVLRTNKRLVFDEEAVDIHQQIILDDPESNLISNEFVAFYNRKIQELPPKCKLVYLMVKDDRLKYKEVADILNISIKTVENQMTKAIGHVRKSLKIYREYHNNIDVSEN